MTRRLGKSCPNFLKGSKNFYPSIKSQNPYIKAQFESPKHLQQTTFEILKYHVRYLSHLALQVGFSNWVHKTRIHSIQWWRHFGAKLADPLSPLERRLHPFFYWIKYSWSGLTNILYYINLSVRWNTLLRNQISSCQHHFWNIEIPTTNHVLKLLI